MEILRKASKAEQHITSPFE